MIFTFSEILGLYPVGVFPNDINFSDIFFGVLFINNHVILTITNICQILFFVSKYTCMFIV